MARQVPSGQHVGMIYMVKPINPGSAERTGLALAAEQSSRDAIIGITRAGVVSSWNPPAVLLYGYLQDDMSAAPRMCSARRGAGPGSKVRTRIIAGGRRSDTKRTGSARTGRHQGVADRGADRQPGRRHTGITTVSRTIGGRRESAARSRRACGRTGPLAGSPAALRREGRRRAPCSREAQERFDSGSTPSAVRPAKLRSGSTRGRRRAPCVPRSSGAVRHRGRRRAPCLPRSSGPGRGRDRERPPRRLGKPGPVRRAPRRRAPCGHRAE